MPAANLGHLLLIDDQPENLDMLSRRLERRGYRVTRRLHALDLEADLAQGGYDLVLLDWMMPQRSGAQALSGLRGTFSKEVLPVIVVTALNDGAVVAEALALGANDYVTKPIDFQVLLARMGAQLQMRANVLAQLKMQDELTETVSAQKTELADVTASLSAEIAERKSAELRAETLAKHDSLTGLFSRNYFLDLLQQQTASAAHLGVLHVSLDRFKSVNDVYGHRIGDRLLQMVAQRIAALVGPQRPVARIGGDEFAILVPELGSDADALSLAVRVREEITSPLPLAGQNMQIEASVGLALYPAHGDGAEALLIHADAAMTQAKGERTGVMLFDVELDRRLRNRAQLQLDLRTAIHEDRVRPYFQPIVHLDGAGLAGYEVLARWPHPSRGMVSPVEFIPIAEEAGLIDPLFWSMTRTAIRTALRTRGHFYLAVNTSPVQIRDPWFPEKLLRLLQETGFPPSRLVVEVTESSMISDLDRAKASLQSIKNQGVRIALDDFGTGYSSLSLLRELPIDKVKIDRSFVTPMLEDASGASIVEAIVGLGRALKLDVVAEGIETAGIAKALAGLKCTYGQGYLFGKAEAQPSYGQDVTAAARA